MNNEGCQRPGVLSKERCACHKTRPRLFYEACAMHRCNSFFSPRDFFERVTRICHFHFLVSSVNVFANIFFVLTIARTTTLSSGTCTTFLREALWDRNGKNESDFRKLHVAYSTRKKNKHVLHESRDKIPFLSIFLSRYILIPKRLFYDKVTL